MATDDTLPIPNIAVCTGSIFGIPVSTRETTAEGRGRIGDAHIFLNHLDSTECRVRISGTFHRIGTVATGRLDLDVHRSDSTFRVEYCAGFTATAVPDPVFTATTLVTAVMEGRTGACANGDTVENILHGRLPGDGLDPLHGDRCPSNDPFCLVPTTLPPVTTTSVTTTSVPVTTTSIIGSNPNYVSNDCDGGPNVFDGFIHSGYVKLRTTTSAVCVAIEAGGTHVGGKLSLPGAGGTPALKTQSDCAANAAYRVQHRDGTLLGFPYWFDVLAKPDPEPTHWGSTPPEEVWVCAFYNGIGSGIAVPVDSGGNPVFIFDPSGPYGYTPTPHTPGKASSDCSALTGTKTVLLNARVVNTQVWTDTRQSGSVTQACVRVEQPYPNPGATTGVRLSVDSTGGNQGIVTVKNPATANDVLPPTTPCDGDVITDTGSPPVVVRYHAGSPAYLCLWVASQPLQVKIDAMGSQSIATQDT